MSIIEPTKQVVQLGRMREILSKIAKGNTEAVGGTRPGSEEGCGIPRTSRVGRGRKHGPVTVMQ